MNFIILFRNISKLLRPFFSYLIKIPFYLSTRLANLHDINVPLFFSPIQSKTAYKTSDPRLTPGAP